MKHRIFLNFSQHGVGSVDNIEVELPYIPIVGTYMDIRAILESVVIKDTDVTLYDHLNEKETDPLYVRENWMSQVDGEWHSIICLGFMDDDYYDKHFK